MKNQLLFKAIHGTLAILVICCNFENLCELKAQDTLPTDTATKFPSNTNSEFALTLSALQPPPRLKFGIETGVHPLGVVIQELAPNRPIASELMEGDILVSYILLDGSNRIFPLRMSDDLDKLKEFLSSGNVANLFVLRHKTEVGPNAYDQLIITIDAGRLTRNLPVQTSDDGTTKHAYVEGFAMHNYSVRSSESAAKFNVETLTERGQIAQVSVYYATDRKLNDKSQYSGERDSNPDPVKYGTCLVTIPTKHKPGELETYSYWRLQFQNDPAEHVVLKQIIELNKELVFSKIAFDFKHYFKSDKKRLLVFIHGYNVSFEDAARRTAQLHYDLKFPGAAMFYSWPSNATYSGYVADKADIEWSAKNIAHFLEQLDKLPTVDEIHLVAHSMGNVGATQALLNLKNKQSGKKIKEVILASADVDAQVFERDIAPQISSYYPRTTVYASEYDVALMTSKELAESKRLGQMINGQPSVASQDKMDLIDTSLIQSDLLGHSTFASHLVISDMKELLLGKKTNERSKLEKQSFMQGLFWKVKAGM